MRRTIYLARHGETDWNLAGRWQGHSDVALNATGRAQARELAAALREHRLERVYSSDLSRARETAQIVADFLGIGQVDTDPRLRERAFGLFEGLTYAECSERYPDHWQRYQSEERTAPPGAEARPEVAARVQEAIHRLAASDAALDATFLIVSHGAAIRAFVESVTGTLPPPLGNGATLRLRFEGGAFSDLLVVR